MNITLTPATYAVTATAGQHLFTLPALPLLLVLDGAFLVEGVDYANVGTRQVRINSPALAGQRLFAVTLTATVS